MGLLLSRHSDKEPKLTYAELVANITAANELLPALLPIIDQHAASTLPESPAFEVPEITFDSRDDDSHPTKPVYVPLSTYIILSSSTSSTSRGSVGVRLGGGVGLGDQLISSSPSIRLPLATYLLLSQLLTRLTSILSTGHLLTSLPKIDHWSSFTDSERIREYMKRNEER